MAYKLFLLTLLGLLIIFLALKYPKKFIYFYFLIKPAVDYFAESGTSFMGYYVSTTYIAGALVPLCALFFVLEKKKNIGVFPFKKVLFAYILINILSFILQGNYSFGTLTPLGILIRVILPIIFYVSIPYILQNEKNIVAFLKVVAFSGIFPMTVAFMQFGGLIPYNRLPEVFGALTLARLTGGYSDSFSLNMPLMIAIFAILFLLQYKNTLYMNPKLRLLSKIFLALYLCVIVFTFHRISYIIMFTTLVLLLVYNVRQYKIVVIFTAIVFVAYFTFDFMSNLFYDAYAPFTAESQLYYSQGFHGRIWLWRKFLSNFFDATFFQKLSGVAMTSRYVHSDYIRVLYSNGIIGLVLYLSLLGAIGLKIFRILHDYLGGNEKFIFLLACLALNIFIAYIFASITLSVSMISSFPWFFWIFSGILFYQTRRNQHTRHDYLRSNLNKQ